ncbi:sterol desaturase [gamma proteobacterium HTCC5015]|nr:sterol desaturase [gamma proteobacterium HTCC5015]
MEFQPQLILIYFAPIFFFCVALEWWLLHRRAGERPKHVQDSANYQFIDTFSNACLAGMHEIGDALAAIGVIALYEWLFGFRLFDISASVWSFLLLVLLQDFCYYWFHRASHRIRWMWASHVVHHSSERLNFSTAFRQSFTYPISGMWVFWLPLVIIGFEPMQVVAAVMLSLAYQFFIHTQWVNKLGWAEKIFNTPSHHRVHHARNPEYIDRNYAGTFIIWDKLFGTFVEERDDLPCAYGITKQVHSHNPFFLTLHEWRDMFTDAFSGDKTPWQRFKHFWAPPEWQPDSEEAPSTPDVKAESGL